MRPRPTDPPPPAALSRAQRRLFTVAMLLIPVLFFVLLEGGLRLAGYGDDYPLFVEAPGAPDYLYQNREVAQRYFSRGAILPTSQINFFRARKDSATLRIIVQGGSSAAGFPFYYGGSFSRMLEQRLQQTFPERHVEVVNTAMSAVNSYTLLDLADEIIAQRPDAVLIYAGHNEYYGALGVGSNEAFGAFPSLIRLYLRLQHLRTVQALRDLLGRVAALMSGNGRGKAPSSTLMERLVREQSIPYGSPLYRAGIRQFRSNLSALLTRYQRAGVPVFIGTLASNERDHAPFINGFAADADTVAWARHIRLAREASERGDHPAALSEALAATRTDSTAAAGFFLLGQLLEEAGRFTEARAAYLAAKDRDLLRFRAPEEMNAIIREEASRQGATVVETRETLAAASPHGIIGNTLILEHLHPNVDGYFRISDAFYRALRANRMPEAWRRDVPADVARAEILLTPVDSLVGMYRIRKLMSSWPFRPHGVVDRTIDTLRATDPVSEVALQLFRDQISWREANNRFRIYCETRGDFGRALRTALAHIQEYPMVPAPYLDAGNALVQLQRFDEALAYYERSNQIQESSPAHRMIGSLLVYRKQYAPAIEHLERALALDPKDQQALYNLSGALALSGQYERARQTGERLLALAPDHAGARQLLQSLPAPRSPRPAG